MQDIENKSNTNSGEPMINGSQLDRNSDPHLNPQIDPSLIEATRSIHQ